MVILVIIVFFLQNRSIQSRLNLVIAYFVWQVTLFVMQSAQLFLAVGYNSNRIILHLILALGIRAVYLIIIWRFRKGLMAAQGQELVPLLEPYPIQNDISEKNVSFVDSAEGEGLDNSDPKS